MGFAEKVNPRSKYFEKHNPGVRSVPYDFSGPILLPQETVPKPPDNILNTWFKRLGELLAHKRTTNCPKGETQCQTQ